MTLDLALPLAVLFVSLALAVGSLASMALARTSAVRRRLQPSGGSGAGPAVPKATFLDQLSTAGRAFYSTTDERMTVRYSPRIARWLAEREGKELDADGGLTLEHPLADESWAIRHVLQYGPDAEILSPARLRRQIVAKLASV